MVLHDRGIWYSIVRIRSSSYHPLLHRSLVVEDSVDGVESFNFVVSDVPGCVVQLTPYSMQSGEPVLRSLTRMLRACIGMGPIFLDLACWLFPRICNRGGVTSTTTDTLKP